jgi:rhodanese-related sulfurtransferase
VPQKDYIIVDVRDDDYRGGNIKGAHNSPSAQFHDNVDKLVQDTKEVPTVIFHCMLSQQRGPKAARVRTSMEILEALTQHELRSTVRGGMHCRSRGKMASTKCLSFAVSTSASESRHLITVDSRIQEDSASFRQSSKYVHPWLLQVHTD